MAFLTDILNYVVDRIYELDWMAVVIGVVIETVIVPIPSPLIPMAAGFALLKDLSGFEMVINLILKIGVPGAVTAALANIPFYYIGLKGGDAGIRLMMRLIGVDREDLESAISILSGRSPLHNMFYRAVPIMPLSLVSLASGVVRMRLRTFFTSTLIGCIPRYLILGFLGYLLRDLYIEMAYLLDSFETALIILIILGIITYLLVKKFLGR